MRGIILFLLLLTLLGARENPFVPGSAADDAPPPLSPGTIVAVDDPDQEAPGPDVTVTEAPYETVDFGNIRFVMGEKEIRVETKDRIKQHFTVKNPTRIILNFTGGGDFPTRRQALKLPPYREIRVGAHEGYYSAVIELDGAARYRFAPSKEGYTLTFY